MKWLLIIGGAWVASLCLVVWAGGRLYEYRQARYARAVEQVIAEAEAILQEQA